VADEIMKVVVIDDHPVFRQGLVSTVESVDDMTVEGAFDAVEAAVRADLESIDVVLLDLMLPGLSGADAVRRIVATGARVLVVSALGERPAVVAAMGAGASGYLTKSSDPNEILTALRVIAAGGSYISPTLASFFLSSEVRLTERERDVLTLLAEGDRDADIARELKISVKTVQGHLDRIRDKTGMRRRADLTRLAAEEGLLPKRTL